MNTSTAHVDALVIGGGFYGCCLALLLRGTLDNIILVEKESDLLLRASAINQARVHTGYHYPRNLVTAFRSFINYPRFVHDFRKAIINDFVKLYAIAKMGSKVNAARFFKMFNEMGAPIKIAPSQYHRIFNQELIEEVFLVSEVAFDADILREILRERLELAKVSVMTNREVTRLRINDNGFIEATLGPEEESISITARRVYNCTYSQINKLLLNSGMELLPFKHELTEMALLRLPEELQNIGVTVMDGPFFSIMPYPSRKLHSLSHVRYTPHSSWADIDRYIDGHYLLSSQAPVSNFPYMIRDAQRFIPLLRESEYVDSLYEIKSVLLQNEIDDGRPILFKQDYGGKGINIIMGSKIDNIYDVLEVIADINDSIKHRSDSWRYMFQSKRHE